MASLIPSLNAHRHLQGAMTACSWRAGWRSLLLRGYEDPPSVDELTTPATADLLIVLVTGGSCDIEARYPDGWQRAHYEPGQLGMTAPGAEATLRWRSPEGHSTLQLHLPAATLHRVYQDLSDRDPRRFELPCAIGSADPLIEQVMRSLARASSEGAQDLYAETAAEMLAAHFAVRFGGLRAARRPPRDDLRLRRVDEHLRGNLGAPLSLEEMARHAGVSRFHLVRLCKQAHGETPFQRLTRFRMEEAQRRLAAAEASITEIAFACGYESSAHFASAFRRVVGVSPSAYRRSAR